MRAILIHADHSPATEARLQTGLDIARATRGHIALHVNTPLQSYVAMDPFGGVYLAANAIADAQARDAALIDRLAEHCAREDVPWRIESSDSDIVEALTSSARLADLVIVTAPPGFGHAGPALPLGRLALSTRSPVLALPADDRRADIGGIAVVGWDGSYEAANALRAAVPLLALASKVHLVTVTEKATAFPATDALRYLSSHEVHAELHERAPGRLSVEETLEAAATELSADWLAMGAYGHARLRETLFGGVTRYFIDAARWPLLLMH